MVISALSLIVSTIIGIYTFIGIFGYLAYRPTKGDIRASNVRFVLTTIASERIRGALTEAITHQVEHFPDYPLYVILDSGSELEAELVADDRIKAIVVPSTYECQAEAKGRAIQYFIETVAFQARLNIGIHSLMMTTYYSAIRSSIRVHL